MRSFFLTLFTAGFLAAGLPAAQAQGVVYNDGEYSFTVVDNGIRKTLSAGRTTATLFNDIDQTVLYSWQCGKASVNYGAWKLIPRTWTVPDGQVHVIAFRC